MRRLGSAALLLLVPSAAWSFGKSQNPLDRLAEAKARCLQKKVLLATEALSSNKVCTETVAPDPMIGKMRDLLCEDPRDFCTEVTELSVDEWMGRFVNSRCEPAGPQSPLAANLLVGEGVRGDSHFAQVMMGLWGCDFSQVRVVPAAHGKDAALFAQYRCNAEKMPFVCGNAKAAVPRGKESSAALRMYGATLEPIAGGKCWISMGRALPGTLPTPKPDGEGIEDYRARVGGDLRQKLSALEGEVGQRAIGLFAATHDLLTHDKSRFLEVARSLLTPETIRVAKENFAIAQRAVIAALRNMNPPPPEAAISQVERARLVDYDGFFAQPPDRFASLLLSTCDGAESKKSEPFGDLNASYLAPGEVSGKSYGTVTACPLELAMAVWTNPRNLVSVFAHELGHAIGPVRLAKELAERALDSGRCETLALGNSAFSGDKNGAQIRDFAKKMRDYSTCLYSHSDYGSRFWPDNRARGIQVREGE